MLVVSMGILSKLLIPPFEQNEPKMKLLSENPSGFGGDSFYPLDVRPKAASNFVMKTGLSMIRSLLEKRTPKEEKVPTAAGDV